MSKQEQSRSKVNPVGGSGSDEGRDSAVTPEWLAKLIGTVELDPCSNPRSHIRAWEHCLLENGSDGLLERAGPGWYKHSAGGGVRDKEARPSRVVYCNPPYARGQVIRWVRHWLHTRFIFCLRWDPRTAWFRELWPHCTHIWWPQETETEIGGVEKHPGRIEFEPPPGVTFSSNPFPHALYMRDPSPELLARLAPHGILLSAQQIVVAAHEAGVQLGGDDTPRSETVSGSGTRGNGEKGAGRSGKGVAKAAKYGSNPLDGRTFCVCDQCGETVEWSNHWCRVRKLSQPS